ncbi:hypothetical protein [Nitrospirillum iridis]|uniref:Uncharacterized protein n=1 Tax=Nitrospirillum iridis TaxID=765888 RepID=A0A7X0B033_9PROT|nr:hypothetical protein [Nitrospirillum iridis]MBB6253283.1 hypothetical protein [Nitrospirillum iridis]
MADDGDGGNSDLEPMEDGDPSIVSLSVVSWSMALAALGAIAALALFLLLIGMSQYAFFMIWFIGAPFVGAGAAMAALFLNLRRPGGPRRRS